MAHKLKTVGLLELLQASLTKVANAKQDVTYACEFSFFLLRLRRNSPFSARIPKTCFYIFALFAFRIPFLVLWPPERAGG